VLKESLELRTIRAVVQAQATLEAGFTTIASSARRARASPTLRCATRSRAG